jgi:carboxylate-amine ligase
VDAELLDPVRMVPVPAAEAVHSLQRHIADSAETAGDETLIGRGLAAILARGTGSTVQRRALLRRGDPCDVVAEAVLAMGGASSDPAPASRASVRVLPVAGR